MRSSSRNETGLGLINGFWAGGDTEHFLPCKISVASSVTWSSTKKEEEEEEEESRLMLECVHRCWWRGTNAAGPMGLMVMGGIFIDECWVSKVLEMNGVLMGVL